jgi:hypothetical protein
LFLYYTTWANLHSVSLQSTVRKALVPRERIPVFAVLPSVSDARADALIAIRDRGGGFPRGLTDNGNLQFRNDFRFYFDRTTGLEPYSFGRDVAAADRYYARIEAADECSTDVVNLTGSGRDLLLKFSCPETLDRYLILEAMRSSRDNGCTYTRWVTLEELQTVGITYPVSGESLDDTLSKYLNSGVGRAATVELESVIAARRYAAATNKITNRTDFATWEYENTPATIRDAQRMRLGTVGSCITPAPSPIFAFDEWKGGVPLHRAEPRPRPPQDWAVPESIIDRLAALGISGPAFPASAIERENRIADAAVRRSFGLPSRDLFAGGERGAISADEAYGLPPRA